MNLIAFKSAFRCVALLLCDTLVCLTRIPFRCSDPKNVLCVRLDGIGDFILWLDASQALPRLYPAETHSIVLLANSVWAPLAERLDLFSKVIPLDRYAFINDLSYRYRLGCELRGHGFSTVFQPTFSRELFQGDAIVRMCGAPVTIGLEGDRINIGHWGKLLADHWYTRLVGFGGAQQMELIRNAEVLRQLGLFDFRARTPRLAPFNSSDLPVQKPYYVLQPGAGLAAKRWPVERFAEIATLIHKVDASLHGVICGGEDDWNAGEEICRISNAPLINSCGSTSIENMVGIVANGQFLVGNDTGAAHLAVAVGTPVVCIVGGGEYGRFFPYQTEGDNVPEYLYCVGAEPECAGCGWLCRFVDCAQEAAPCVLSISVEDVWLRVKKYSKITDLKL